MGMMIRKDGDGDADAGDHESIERRIDLKYWTLERCLCRLAVFLLGAQAENIEATGVVAFDKVGYCSRFWDACSST